MDRARERAEVTARDERRRDPLLAWGTILLVLAVGNWIWNGKTVGSGAASAAVLDHLRLRGGRSGCSRREAIRRGPPEPRDELETVPQVSLGAPCSALSARVRSCSGSCGPSSSSTSGSACSSLVGSGGSCSSCAPSARSAPTRSSAGRSAGERAVAARRCSSRTGRSSPRRSCAAAALGAACTCGAARAAARPLAAAPDRCRSWPGSACVLVALQSGLDAYDDRLLSVHMVQHLLLLMVAPPLLLGGRPVILALRALPRAAPRPRPGARSDARASPRRSPVARRVRGGDRGHPPAVVLRRDAAPPAAARRRARAVPGRRAAHVVAAADGDPRPAAPAERPRASSST